MTLINICGNENKVNFVLSSFFQSLNKATIQDQVELYPSHADGVILPFQIPSTRGVKQNG